MLLVFLVPGSWSLVGIGELENGGIKKNELKF